MARRKNKFQKRSIARRYLIEAGFEIGRFSDRDKTLDQLMALQEADNLIEKSEYIEAFEKFLVFLKNDSDNLSYERKDDTIIFKIHQGSKIIEGKVNKEKIVADADMFLITSDNPELYKKILELNHSLKFAKFYLEENKIVLQVNQFLDKITTELLYYSLRELAIVADKYDDFFEVHFSEIKPINKHHIVELDEETFKVKVNYLRKWINEALEKVSNLNPVEMASARSFILMSAIYKIIVLINPEGELIDYYSELIDYFYKSSVSQAEKNMFLIRKLKEVSQRNETEFKNSLYKVTKTFSENLPVESKVILDFMKQEYEKIFWYDSNGYEDIVLAISDYIAGYIDYHFSLVPVLKDLLLLYWEVMEKEYFNDSGINKLPYEKNSISYFLLARNISAINNIAKEHFAEFNFNVKHLNLENRYSFAKSFLQEIINLDFSIKENE